jgi:hypothetical protein
VTLYDGNANVNGGYGNVLATAPFTTTAPPAITPSGKYLLGFDYYQSGFNQTFGINPMLEGCGNADCTGGIPQHFGLPSITSQADAATAAGSIT